MTLGNILVNNIETLDEIAVQVLTCESLLWVAGGLLA